MHRNVLEISRNLGRVCSLSQTNIKHKTDHFRMSRTWFYLGLKNIRFRDRIKICHIKCLFSAKVFWYVMFDRIGRCMLCFSVSNAKRKEFFFESYMFVKISSIMTLSIWHWRQDSKNVKLQGFNFRDNFANGI